MPEGKNWLEMMVRNFTPETEFVLGYGGYLPQKGFLNKLIKYDTLFIALQYLGMVASQTVYGCGEKSGIPERHFLQFERIRNHA